MLLLQASQGGGRGAKLALHLLECPRLGGQPVHQVGPDALEAEFGGAVGGALLGSMLPLAGELLAAGRLGEVVVGDGVADGRGGGGEVGGELGDAPAVVQQGVQAAAQVGEAQPRGLLVEVAVAGIVNREAAPED